MLLPHQLEIVLLCLSSERQFGDVGLTSSHNAITTQNMPNLELGRRCLQIIVLN